MCVSVPTAPPPTPDRAVAATAGEAWCAWGMAETC